MSLSPIRFGIVYGKSDLRAAQSLNSLAKSMKARRSMPRKGRRYLKENLCYLSNKKITVSWHATWSNIPTYTLSISFTNFIYLNHEITYDSPPEPALRKPSTCQFRHWPLWVLEMCILRPKGVEPLRFLVITGSLQSEPTRKQRSTGWHPKKTQTYRPETNYDCGCWA